MGSKGLGNQMYHPEADPSGSVRHISPLAWAGAWHACLETPSFTLTGC